MMLTTPDTWFLLAVIALAAVAARLTRKIDTWGAILGAIFSSVLVWGVGWLGLAALGVFFIAGTLASVWRLQEKESQGVAERRRAQRGIANVLGNALVPALFAAVAWYWPSARHWMEILVAVGFASATSDTLSSEMGNIYGTRYYNIITWQPDRRGEDGAVSLEGFLFGLLGSMLIALTYYGFTGKLWPSAGIVLAGFAGNLIDSLLGATLQRKGYLNNHLVNLLSMLGASGLTLLVLACLV